MSAETLWSLWERSSAFAPTGILIGKNSSGPSWSACERHIQDLADEPRTRSRQFAIKFRPGFSVTVFRRCQTGGELASIQRGSHNFTGMVDSKHIAQVSLLIFLLCHLSHGQGEVERVQQLKAFVEKPPYLKEMVFSCSSTFAEAKTNFYFVRWQPNAFFVKQASKLEGALSPGTDQAIHIVGRFGNTYWSMENGLEVERGAWPLRKTRSRMLQKIDSVLLEVRDMLDFGFFDMEVGTVSWHGNTFTNESYVFGEHKTMGGELLLANRSFVSATYCMGPAEKQWNPAISYTWDDPPLAGWPLPRIVEVTDTNRSLSGSANRWRFEIIKANMAGGPMPNTFFNYQKIFQGRRLPVDRHLGTFLGVQFGVVYRNVDTFDGFYADRFFVSALLIRRLAIGLAILLAVIGLIALMRLKAFRREHDS
jgi:hypothetical protein